MSSSSSSQPTVALSPLVSTPSCRRTSAFHAGLCNEVVERDGDLLTSELTTDAAAQQPQPPPSTSRVMGTTVSTSDEPKMEKVEVTVTNTGKDIVFGSSAFPPTPPKAAADNGEVRIERLKMSVQRLKADIQHIQSHKSRLLDWFLEQMLVARISGDDGASVNGGNLPEDEIKRRYKKSNAELKQRLNELEARLSDAILMISHLEGQQGSETEGQINRSFSSIAAISTSEEASITESTYTSPTTKTASTPTKEPKSMAVRDHYQQQQENEKVQGGFPSAPTSSKSPFIAPSGRDAKGKALRPMKLDVSLVSQPSSMASESIVTATDSSRITQLGLSGSSEPSIQPRFFLDDPMSLSSAVSNHPLASSTKKPRMSARRALKHGFTFLTKSIGRRSDVHKLSSSPTCPLKKSVSAEYLHTAAVALGAPSGSSTLNKVTSATNARPMSSNTGTFGTSKWKKANKQDDSCITDYLGDLEANAGNMKKSYTDFMSSRLLHHHKYIQHYRPYTVESEATSAADSERSGALGSSSSPPLQHRRQSAQQTTGPSTSGAALSTLAQSNVNDVIDVLYGGSTDPCTGLPRGNFVITSSGGASTYSGGGCATTGVSNGPPTVGLGTAAGGSGCNLQLYPSTSPPPAYNVAMALVMLHQRIHTLLEAHAEAQQTLTAEIREELASLRMDLTETRNIASSITAEVEALKRDMLTKEEVQNQKLLDAVARLEQLDASAEKLRQNVQQDLISISNEQKHAIEPINYQLATETRDLRDMFTTLSNKVVILEKCERLANLDRDQPLLLRTIANTLTNLVVSLVAFVTTLIQMLIRFLNAGATVTNNRISAIVLNVCLLVFLLVAFWAEPLVRWWCGGANSNVQQPPR